MSVHDALVVYRRRVVVLVEMSPNRRAACRQLGIHHSTFTGGGERFPIPGRDLSAVSAGPISI